MWLLATVLDRRVLEFSNTSLHVLVLHGWLNVGHTSAVGKPDFVRS